MAVASSECVLCRATHDGEMLTVREMLLGTRHPFEYFECVRCGTVQIARIPDDLGAYYPREYYSYGRPKRLRRAWLRRPIERVRVRGGLARGWLPALLGRVARAPDYVRWCRHAGVGTDARVLDVGCGGGDLLVRMALGGFEHLEGIDPFLEGERCLPGRVVLHPRSVHEQAALAPGAYDLVMFHHSFEHVEEPAAVLEAVRALLAPGGRLLLRLPLAGGEAWRSYGTDWVQLDAPRHLFLPSEEALVAFARRAGFETQVVEYDSTAFQFVGSELYRRDISLTAPARERAIFDEATMRGFAAAAAALNEAREGDQAGFVMRLA